MKPFIDLGTRNKGTFWEYLSAYSFLHTKLPVTKYEIPYFLGFGQGEQNKHCHHQDVIETTRKLLIKEFKAGKYIESFFQQMDDLYRKPLRKIKQLVEQDYTLDNNKKLAEKIDFITKAIAETHKPMLLALKTLYLNDYFSQELYKVLTDKEKTDKSKTVLYTSLLLTPTKITLAQVEEDQLFEIQKLFEDKYKTRTRKEFEQFLQNTSIQKKINQLVKTAGWFHMEYMQDPWGFKDYENELWKRIQSSPINSLPSPKLRRLEIKKKQKEFFDSHPDSNVLEKLAFVLREFSFILDASKAVLVEGSYVVRPLFTYIANKLGLGWQDMLYLVLPEIRQLLISKSKADKSLIKARKKARVVLLEDGKISVYEGTKAAKLGHSLVQEEYQKDIQEIKGIIAYPGKVQGKVTMVSSINDKDKFSKGDILVTHDGTAELTLFLKQASAIVTDQGGMISHVAIIAREMKTPCIVATKVATKVFKDGDLVEVDADQGIIKKL
jgi:phosphohistidine swiveling domain-containing protein